MYRSYSMITTKKKRKLPNRIPSTKKDNFFDCFRFTMTIQIELITTTTSNEKKDEMIRRGGKNPI